MTLNEDRYTVSIISHSFLLRMRNIFQTTFIEKIKIYFVLSNFFFSENRSFYEKMCKNIVEWGRATDDTMEHAHCILDT